MNTDKIKVLEFIDIYQCFKHAESQFEFSFE